MSELYNEIMETQAYYNKRRKLREEAENLAKESMLREEEERRKKAESIRDKFENKAKQFGQFKDNVKKKLVREAICNIVKESIYNPTLREEALCEALVYQYVDESGVENLLKKMRLSNNELLRSIYENTEDSYKEITKDATMEDPNSQTMDQEDLKDFWKKVTDSSDIDDVTNMIRLRVANAEEEFVNRNIRDKENINTIMQDTAARVQAAKDTNDNDYSDAVAQEESAIAKDAIYKVQHEGQRNVFGKMVINLGELAMTKEPLRKEFVLENGRLDVDKVVETVRCMYTVLETVSSLNLEKVDDKYIEETLNSMR